VAIDFPNSPTNGQEYSSGSVTWTYDGTAWNLKSTAATTNDSMPIGAIMWFANTTTTPPGWLAADGTNVSRTTYAALFAIIGTTYGIGDGSTTFGLPNISATTGKYYVRYTTAVGTQTTTSLATAPVGTMLDWPTTSSYPTGYLRADGSAVSRTSYADLFALIGTTYGSGDGSTTFNLPNLPAAGTGSPVKIIKASLGGTVEPSTVAHAASHTEGGSDVVSVTLNQVPNYQSNRNWIINGGFDVWQRSTDVTASTVSGTYYAAADRWQTWLGSATNIRYQRVTGTNNTYAYRIQRASGSTVATNTQITQGLEQLNARKLAGKTVTLSFWARCGANFSPSSNTLSGRIYTSTTPNLNIITTGGAVLLDTVSSSLTTTMTRYTLTATVPSNAEYVGVNFIVNWTGTAGADDWFELENVQLEVGSVATPFEFEPFETTLRKCQRYYEKSFTLDQDPTDNPSNKTGFLQAQALSATNYLLFPTVVFSVKKRAIPAITFYNPGSGTAGRACNTNALGTSYPVGTNHGALGSSISTAGFNVQVNNTTTSGVDIAIHWTASAEL